MANTTMQSQEQTTRESPLDLALLSEMAEMGVDGLRELIEMYLAQADEMLGTMQKAIAADQADEVERLAHKLAGSSAACGAAEMMHLLRGLEENGREKRMTDAAESFPWVLERMSICRNLLLEYLDEKGAV
jgi:HPt (histidine-containing phosphotransfer) domain-containing protein